jgi:hypothetical protein
MPLDLAQQLPLYLEIKDSSGRRSPADNVHDREQITLNLAPRIPLQFPGENVLQIDAKSLQHNDQHETHIAPGGSEVADPFLEKIPIV